jgi:RND family efflux transporter MFP subunit
MKLKRTNYTPGMALILALAAAMSCKPAGSVPPPAAGASSGQVEGSGRAAVKTTPALVQAFQLRTFSTGVLSATTQTVLKANTSGYLRSLPIHEGSFEKSGSLLAQLDTMSLHLRLDQARLTLEEAENSKNDLLVMQGGKWGVDSSINAQQLQNILLQSGYKKARHAIVQLEYELAQTKITAPFDGIVTEVKVKQHQSLNAGEAICTLIDPYSFEAEFQLLEKEALQVEAGQVVKVQPLVLPERELRATVSSINPVVDEKGLVRLHAKIRREDLQRYRSRLLEGMNVRVVMEKPVPGQLVVPKPAVVLRSGRPVVFTYDPPSGLAKWNYVTVAYENDTEAAISEGLKAGDLVIYEGNLNLDHDAAVTIEN